MKKIKNIKQYTIGFIVGVTLITASNVYGAVNGSIGSLFEYLSGNENGISIINQWRLDGKNIKDSTVTEYEIADNSIGNAELKNNGNFTFDGDIQFNGDTNIDTPNQGNDIANKTYVDIKNMAQNNNISSNTNRIINLETGTGLGNRYYLQVDKRGSGNFYCNSGYVVTGVNYDSKNDDHINGLFCSKLQ